MRLTSRARATLALFSCCAILMVGLVGDVLAGTCDIQSLPTTGTMTAARFNARYQQIEACINGGIGDTNVDSSDPISVSNIANNNAVYAVSATSACGSVTALKFRPYTASEVIGISAACRGCSAADHDITMTVNGVGVTLSAAFEGIDDENTVADMSIIETAVTTAQDVVVSIAQTTAGSCAAWSIVVFLKAQHQAP